MSLLPALLLSLACRSEPEPLDRDGDGATDETDCDDLDDAVHPDAEEVCDGIDNDCDGSVDVSATDASPWYLDADGDGHGTEEDTAEACEQPTGYVARSGDCDDENARYHPGAVEEDCADPEDYNCDGSVGYEDADEDGFAACEDCDDGRDDVYDGADEVCDEADNDCDGSVDEDAVDAEDWYLDADGDGYGTDRYTLAACEQPEGYVDNAEDCDDLHAASLPGGSEVCDGHDNDCDGSTDEDASDAPTWFYDSDGDGFGNEDSPLAACEVPSGYVDDDNDCDDGDADVNPAATETCNEVDDDCDGDTDEDAVDAETWYADLDGDGYGGSRFSTDACEAPGGYTSSSSDCDDLDDTAYPGGTEVCDGADNDCDGDTDEDATDEETWYADSDGDGYGDSSTTTTACDEPSGYTDDDNDCDDGDADVNPAATETCNEVDDDCDGDTDEGAAGGDTWYADADADGYGDASTSVEACDQPSGYVDNSDDCDDDEELAWTGATEEVDGVDNDCDGEGYHGDYSATSSTSLAGGEWEFTSFEVSSTTTLTITGDDPLEVWVLGDATIDGSVDLTGSDGGDIAAFYTEPAGGDGGGGGGGDAGNGDTYDGTSPATAPDGDGDSPGLGGTSYSSGSGGGGGGQADAGDDGDASGGCYTAYDGGDGGGAVSSSSTPSLTPGSGGGGGGWGGGYNADGGGGGGGGGAFYLQAETLDIAGSISCDAGDGGGNSSTCWHGGGGGGGSGGTLWFVADTLSVSGSLNCSGGSGGDTYSCGHCGTAGAGGDGADGMIWLDADTLSVTGSVTPSYSEP